jgi:hypothetical protein
MARDLRKTGKRMVAAGLLGAGASLLINLGIWRGIRYNDSKMSPYMMKPSAQQTQKDEEQIEKHLRINQGLSAASQAAFYTGLASAGAGFAGLGMIAGNEYRKRKKYFPL